jgi:SAM-dependent methyltransferase
VNSLPLSNTVQEKELRFGFGKNWRRFLRSLSDERIRQAELSLADFLLPDSVADRSFLDIGCGSGLFSYAAWRLGASKILSFDIDPYSVDCTRRLHEKAGRPRNWHILEGSILDARFIAKLGRFDVVYSWGVLHHTGRMWDAINNAARLVSKDGHFYIALYNKVEGPKGSEVWLRLKKLYNSFPPLAKRATELAYFLRFLVTSTLKLKNPIREIWNYQSHRGMNWYTDVLDWLGGYPYEFATVEELFKFVRKEFPCFELQNLKSVNSLANNQFVFKARPGAC